MATRQERITTILEQLSTNIGSDITGAVAVGADGIVLVSRMGSDINADRVGAVAATMMGVTKRVAGEIRIGATEQAIITAGKGTFLVLPAGEHSLLAVSLREGANLGLVRLEAHEAALAIAEAL